MPTSIHRLIGGAALCLGLLSFAAFQFPSLQPPQNMQNTQGFPDYVKAIDARPNQVTRYQGDLGDGQVIEDLTWASRSSVACFPATQNAKFRGHHALHSFQIPPYSEVTVRVIPDDPKENLSLYGYQVGTTNFSVPPSLPSCVSCEADHKWDRPHAGKTQDHTRSVFFNSIRNPYNIVIGVVGGEGQTSGGYTLEIDLKSKVEAGPQGSLHVERVEVTPNSTVTVQGDLSKGTPIQDLSFASRSSVACWPGTQDQKFNGNHIFFVTEIPPYSEMTITATPADKQANISLYAYQDGTTSEAFPPALSSCVSCEADHKWDYPKRGKTQDHSRSVRLNAIRNPYRVVIAVAGAEGLDAGQVEIKIETVSRQ